MIHFHRIPVGVVVILFAASCAQDVNAPDNFTMATSLAADQCVNVDARIDALLGLWMLDGALVPGATPAPAVIGGIDGWLGSVLTPAVTTHGRSQTVHWVLHHVFVTGAPALVDPGLGFTVPAIDLSSQTSWFVTDDRAVCAAAGDGPLSCRVNDVLDVVAGAGIFSGADGFLHNHGDITITDPVTGAGTGKFHLRGRICGQGV